MTGDENSLQNKVWPLENPQNFVKPLLQILHIFLIPAGNSTSFLINPRKFFMLFLQYPLKFHVLNLLTLVFFTGIAHLH